MKNLLKRCGDGGISILPISVNSIPVTPHITQNGDTLISNAIAGNQWYNLSNGIINNETAQSYLPLQIGNYFVIVTVNTCASDSSNVIYFNNTGIERNNMNLLDVNIIPNPFANFTRISYSLLQNENVELSIIDVSGKEIYKVFSERQIKGKQIYIFNADKLSAGIYFYRLKTGNEINTGKFIVQR